MKHLKAIMIALALATISGLATIATVTVGTTETEVLPAKASARTAVICNTGTNTVYLKIDSSTNAVTTSNGIPLQPGASLTITATGAANPSRNRITAITATTNGTLAVQQDDAQ